MNMKSINDLLNMTLRRKKQIVKPNISLTPRTMMKDVVPHLTQEDFFSKWKEDVQELKKTKEELTKYKKIVNTSFSQDWRNKLNEEDKK